MYNFLTPHQHTLIVCSGHSQPLLSHEPAKGTGPTGPAATLLLVQNSSPLGAGNDEPPARLLFTCASIKRVVWVMLPPVAQSPGDVYGVFCLVLAVKVSALCCTHSFWCLKCDSVSWVGWQT